MYRVIFFHLFNEIFHYRKKPVVIQLPITSRCNSRCLTCNVWKNNEKIDIDPDKLKNVFTDPYLNKVKVIGINGGEISLYKNDIIQLIEACLTLPRLKEIYIISNGLLSERLLQLLRIWKQECTTKGLLLTVTLSIDGIGDINNMIRGISTGFQRTTNTLELLLKDRDSYSDKVRLGCTISKYNVEYLSQIDTILSQYSLPIEFHLAVPNKRIGTFEQASYSVLDNDRSRLLAAEFFLGKSIQSRKIFDKFVYFANYYYLINKGIGRLSSCSYQKRNLTIDEKLNLYLCATASNKISNLNEDCVTKSMQSGELKKVEKELYQSCESCIHYAAALPSFRGMVCFAKYLISNRFSWNLKYKYLAKWQKLC